MRIDILRRRPGENEAHWQGFQYDPADDTETVATALIRLNEQTDDPIRWECSCLQKKCGACAMVINGRPGLACDARLTDYKKGVRLEPLRKFPVVADLIVNRSVLYENLRAMRLWLETEADMHQKAAEMGYEASMCLQCGCCLDVCPNFAPDGDFFGMAAAVPVTRLLAELPKEENTALVKAYREHVYAGCGKSLACRSICPAGIDIDELLVNSNAVAVWKRILKSKGRKHHETT